LNLLLFQTQGLLIFVSESLLVQTKQSHFDKIIKKNRETMMKNLFGSPDADSKSLEFLTKVIERNNLPGFDYLEFKGAIENLSKFHSDEALAFRSAFATASTLGLTKEKLLETAQHYRKLLQNEKAQFEAASQKQQEQRIGAKLKHVADLKAQIAANELKIKQLQSEIDKAKSETNHADFEIEKEVQKINETKTRFASTHEIVLKQIDKDIENIGKYL
jgi:predicted transcriptional regulator